MTRQTRIRHIPGRVPGSAGPYTAADATSTADGDAYIAFEMYDDDDDDNSLLSRYMCQCGRIIFVDKECVRYLCEMAIRLQPLNSVDKQLAPSENPADVLLSGHVHLCRNLFD